MIILGLGYSGLRSQVPTPNAPVEKLIIALPELPQTALVHIAVVQGYFAEQGLDVVILPASHGVAALGSLLEGKADIAIVADVPFVLSVMQGHALGMLASLSTVEHDNAIIARRDRGIVTVGDLTGKKVGVTAGTSVSYFLSAFLIRNKVPPGSITLVDLPPGRIVAALTDGSVDAVAVSQPDSYLALAPLGKNAVSFSEIDTYRTTTAAVSRSEFLKAHAGAAEKFVRALLAAEQFTRSRPEETLTLAANWVKADAEALRPTWKHFNFRVNLLQSQLVTLEDEARWAMAGGYAAAVPVPNFLPNLYLDALLAVAPERVTVLR